MTDRLSSEEVQVFRREWMLFVGRRLKAEGLIGEADWEAGTEAVLAECREKRGAKKEAPRDGTPPARG